jgi:hypothetical protein
MPNIVKLEITDLKRIFLQKDPPQMFSICANVIIL